MISKAGKKEASFVLLNFKLFNLDVFEFSVVLSSFEKLTLVFSKLKIFFKKRSSVTTKRRWNKLI